MLSKSIGSHTSKSNLMRALVSKDPGEVGIIEKRIPTPDRDEAVIKTTCALLGESDLLQIRDRSHHSTNSTLGSQATGIIHEVGTDVDIFEPGDRVVVSGFAVNRFVPSQMSGHAFPASGICVSDEYIGPKDGVLADYFSVRQAESGIARIPDTVSDAEAVYCSAILPSAIALVEKASIPAGGTVAIFGDGPVALIATAAAHLAGSAMVLSIGSKESRTLSMEYGADEFICSADADAARRILFLTDKHGADVSIVASGTTDVLMDSASITRAGGIISVDRIDECPATLGRKECWLSAGLSERTVVTGLPLVDRKYLDRMLKLVEMKRIDTSKFTTHSFAFETLAESLKSLETIPPATVSALVAFS